MEEITKKFLLKGDGWQSFRMEPHLAAFSATVDAHATAATGEGANLGAAVLVAGAREAARVHDQSLHSLKRHLPVLLVLILVLVLVLFFLLLLLRGASMQHRNLHGDAHRVVGLAGVRRGGRRVGPLQLHLVKVARDDFATPAVGEDDDTLPAPKHVQLHRRLLFRIARSRLRRLRSLFCPLRSLCHCGATRSAMLLPVLLLTLRSTVVR